MPDSLVVVGREFDGFHRSLTAQLSSLDLPARYELLEISDLQHRLIEGDAATSGAYDVLMVVTDWLPSLIESGKVLPLDFSVDAPDGWPDQWVPALRALQTGPDGQTYGVAYHDGPMLFLYRTDLYGDPVEQAGFADRFGYPLAVPSTWDEYRDQAIWFTRPGLYGTVLAGFPDEHNNVYDFLMHLWSRGGELVVDGRSGLDSPSARSAIDFIDDLWHGSQVVDPAAAGWDSVESGVRFAAGAGAMMVNWCGFASLSSPPDSPTHGLVGCAPVPGGTSRVTMNAYWVLAVPAGAKDPAHSAELIRQLTTREMDVVTAQSGGSATRLDSWADPRVSSLAPYYGVLADAHQDSRSVPVDPRWPEMALILNDMMIQVIEHRAGHAALTEAHERLDALLRKD
ncbi:multiple sugar transport system substrate-binding protein [Asanoa hainanensis]|uniref:Multiple sugar transport system substrate-binding protein n=1 Tax=Asanoa hainanensis TaxID=560556 RepID=A0A239N7E9_9ACTN|nr:extracellular solute-binding protein [Asanoa hainanensis]SNT50402.1 multiple sugar transport system substrate-binding protein [Asanoa hainanensis]